MTDAGVVEVGRGVGGSLPGGLPRGADLCDRGRDAVAGLGDECVHELSTSAAIGITVGAGHALAAV